MMRCAVLSLVLALATEANLAAQEAPNTLVIKVTGFNREIESRPVKRLR